MQKRIISKLIFKNYCTSSKLHLPQPRIFQFKKKTDSGHHACVTKQSQFRFSRNMVQAQNSTCLMQEFSLTQEYRQCTPCVCNKTISNQIFHETWYKQKIPPALTKNFRPQKKTDIAHNLYLTKEIPTASSNNFHH